MKKEKSYVDLVLEHILDDFEKERIESGNRVNTADVSRQLGISRGPVREALHILAGQGVIALEKDRGAILKPMSKQDITGLWDVLNAVCGVGLKLAGEKAMDNDNSERIALAMEGIRNVAAIERSYRFYAPFNEFHYEVNEIGGNRQINETLFKVSIPYWNIFLAKFIDVRKNRHQYILNYQRITDALLCGDGDSAASLFAYHCNWSKRLIISREDTD